MRGPNVSTPLLLVALRRFENDLLALGLDPREFRLETSSAGTAKALLRHLRAEIWAVDLRDLTQADGSLAVGRLTMGMSSNTDAAPEPA